VLAAFLGGAVASPTFSYGSALTELRVWADDANTTFALFAASGASLKTSIISVASAGTGANNTVTIGGLTSLASGSADIWISQVPSSIVSIIESKEEEKKEIDTLKTQVRDLGRMMRALLVQIPDNEEKDIDLVDLEDVRGPARLPKLERSMPIVGLESGILSSISRNSTPNKVNSGWFAGAK